eukprot:TRINITY_DN5479_c0_g1_i1.p1 TRINITY_DN5479_c0_g1~~TRINITY_DN5479_c0_g1_i1.p1  ORF type:complete len:735 (+),score=161.32 TRINITY_DN5479_c0_g1_i1:88-2205(+)
MSMMGSPRTTGTRRRAGTMLSGGPARPLTPVAQPLSPLLSPRADQFSETRSEPSAPGGYGSPRGPNNVQVMVRVRPFTDEQLAKWLQARKQIESSTDPGDWESQPWWCSNPDGPSSVLSLEKDGRTLCAINPAKPDDVHMHKVDHCFWSQSALEPGKPPAGNRDVYEMAGAPVLDAALEGYNACIFAYGQTGSGKTHTMLGTPDDPGLTRILISELFKRLAQIHSGSFGGAAAEMNWTVKIAFMEIYDEKVRDLLVAGADTTHFTARRVRDLGQEGVQVEDLRQIVVKSAEEAMVAMAEGTKARVVASTAMNATSSRSHAIFQIVVDAANPRTRVRRTAQMNLVDLAGSENLQQSKAQGQHAKEAIRINQSLSNLRLVFDRLLEAQRKGGAAGAHGSYVPFRDSVLTQVLRPALGGNSKTTMIATVSGWHDNYAATENTLRYAVKARKITCAPTKNEKGSGALVNQYKEELETLRGRLAAMEASYSGDMLEQMQLELQEEVSAKEEALVRAKQHKDELEEKAAELTRLLDRERERVRQQEETHKEELLRQSRLQASQRVADRFRHAAARGADREKHEELGRSLTNLKGLLEEKENELQRVHTELAAARSQRAESTSGAHAAVADAGQLEKWQRRCARLRRQRDEERYRWRVHASVSRALLGVIDSLTGRHGPSGAGCTEDAAALRKTVDELAQLLQSAGGSRGVD